MLTELNIQNIAVIKKASIPFTEGFNVFTGETGAGKTILISAIDMVLGERTSRDIIRSGEEKAQVSAFFEDISQETQKLLADFGFESEDGSLLIFREINAGGKNNCRINGMPATVGMLKEMSDRLINIHGQRDTGQLTKPENHLKLVDDYGELKPDITIYQSTYDELQKVKKKYSELDMDESQKLQRMEMLEFQIKEIEAANLEDKDEEENLQTRRKLVAGSEKIKQNLSLAMNAYFGSDDSSSINSLIGEMSQGLEKASENMPDLQISSQRLQDLKYELSDIAYELQQAFESLDFDPLELDQIERRLDVIYNLKRKYGGSVEEIIEYYKSAVEEFESIALSDEKKKQLEIEIEKLEEKALDLAKKLSRKRAVACKKFITQVESQLAFLDMPNVKLSVAHENIGLNKTGTDSLEFLIATNLGEQPKPLAKIASGGELARIMLSIKDVLADKDDIETLIFDEIDTGVSGKAAGKIGRKLSEVSKSRQVICVTHLAQVAAFADNHLYIHKEDEKGRTYTLVDQLSHEGSVKELARITSGEVITEAALATAEELIERAKKPYTEK